MSESQALIVHESDGSPITTESEVLPTVFEIWALAEKVLNERQFAFLKLVYSPDAKFTKKEIKLRQYALFEKAGYQRDNKDAPNYLRSTEMGHEIQKIFRKLEKTGLSRKVMLHVLCGPSDEDALMRLDKLMKHKDGKVSVKAVELFMKKRRWIEGGKPTVVVNNQTNIQTNFFPDLDKKLAEVGV
jgi:CO dehydrogenase/acetyl-CoA synthase alpha subunit